MALADLLLRGAGALGQRLAATQQPQAPTTPAAPNPMQTAFTNALVNPNMPIEAGFRTESAKTNADLERQARIRNQLLAGRSAIIERARLQGRQVDIDPNTGAPIISGPVTQQLVNGQLVGVRPSGLLESQVMTTPTGQRFVFDREGRVVGTSAPVATGLDAVDRAAFNQGQGTVSEQRRLSPAIQQAFQQALRGSMASPATPVAAAAPAMAAPAVAAPAPTMAAPAVTAPVVDIPSRLTAPRPPLASATRVPPAVEPQITPEEELAQAQQFLQEEPARVAEEQAQARSKTYEQQVAETTRELARARVQRDQGAVRRLTARLTQLMAGRPGTTASEQAVQERLGREAVRRAMPPLGF